MKDSKSQRSDNGTQNRFVANKLAEVADLLDQQNASHFRVRAYRDAADYVAALSKAIGLIYEQEGRKGLEALPTIGASIANAIIELIETGDLGILDRLRGATDPVRLFQTVPMIGPALAQTIHDDLHIDSLEDLEAAAFDGRLADLKGIGQRRNDSIRHSLNDMLARRRPRQSGPRDGPPTVRQILDIDEAYRGSLQSLPAIKPRRFNPTGERQIPILHTEIEDWRFTALFSNTAVAHRFGRTKDWVVVYHEREGHREGQSTVVTQHGGPMDGKRVIRGREEACARYYGI